jgi:polar amino acid transport system substrate-binding protein
MRTGDLEVVGQLQGEKMECSAAAFNLQDKDLRDAYDKTLAEMKQSGEFDRIVAPYGFNPAFSKANKRDDLCSRAD